MWLILFIGAFVVAASRKSSRESSHEAAPPSRQLPSPRQAPSPPGPIAVLGEILRIGQMPSPEMVIYAVAEAQAIGRHDLASDITRAFGAPAVFSSWKENATAPPHSRGMPSPPDPFQRLNPSPRAAQVVPAPAPAKVIDIPQPSRPPTEEEYLAMLHTDPQALFSMSPFGMSPVVIQQPAEVSVPASLVPPPASPLVAAASAFSPLPTSAAFAEQLFEIPGFAGVVTDRVNPLTGEIIFEVRWLRGYPIPPLPSMIEGRSVHLVITEDLPPSEGDVTEFTAPNAVISPGSPLSGIPDNAWREFVNRLSREEPTFSSARSVGQYRQRRERLAELGIDPGALHGAPDMQREALDRDLSNAYQHAAAGGLFAEHLGRAISVPGHEGEERVTLSGILGLIQCAGLEGAVGWLEQAADRKRFPHTTQLFLRTNGIF